MALAVQNIHGTIGEYQRNYLYMVFIDNIPDYVQQKLGGKAQTFQSEVDIYNKTAIFPNRKTANITIKWSGEFFDIPGVDESTRETDLEFEDDEDMLCYDFFMALKDITGNEINQAGVKGIDGKFNMTVKKVSVDKRTVTAARRLFGVRVYGVETGELKKDAEDRSIVKVSIRWDRNIELPDLRGEDLGVENLIES